MTSNERSAHATGTPPHQAPLFATMFSAGRPLLIGLGVFLLYMWVATRSEGIPAPVVTLVAASPFKGIDLVYGMLFASLATVGTATLFYLGELEDMMLRAARVGSGVLKIRLARRILRVTIGLNALLFLGILLIKGILRMEDACSFKTLLTQAKWHDLAVALIFIAFIVADLLTYLGLRETMAKPDADPEHRQHAQWDSDFAMQQLWLVDVPVLIGAVVSVLAVYFAAGVNNWDSNLLHLQPQIENYMQGARLTSVLICDNRPLSLPEFQASIARIFTAGIAMGYLAAHVLMSQFVFIALSVFHRLRRRPTGPDLKTGASATP